MYPMFFLKFPRERPKIREIDDKIERKRGKLENQMKQYNEYESTLFKIRFPFSGTCG